MTALAQRRRTPIQVPTVPPTNKIWALLLSVSAEEAKFAKRGFRSSCPSRQARLENIGETFLAGFNYALRESNLERLSANASHFPVEMSGFFFEGAGMASALMDGLAPWGVSRFQALLRGPGSAHKYMVHVGAGWALARLPVRWNRFLKKFDPLLRWLILDGYGFHEGYFHWPKYLNGLASPPKSLSRIASNIFDQGLGRSLWFVTCADTDRLAETISGFEEERQRDLWSGVGLACAYAGGVDDHAMKELKDSAGIHSACLQQGATFAAKARALACNQTSHTELACQVFCQMSAAAAAEVTDKALAEVQDCGDEARYQAWRAKIRDHFREARSTTRRLVGTEGLQSW
jgi:hypothetical protein